MSLYRNKYRVESARLKNWDYSSDGFYFITICTQNREHFLGEIVNATMDLNDIGKLANNNWRQIPDQFDFVKLDAFIVMPNHVHGIIIINDDHRGRDAINRVSTTININRISTNDYEKTKIPGGITKTHNPMLQENVSRVIRWFKGRTTFESRKINPDFSWQTLFYDHIIRNDNSLNSFRTYIQNNPKMWERDRNTKLGLYY